MFTKFQTIETMELLTADSFINGNLTEKDLVTLNNGLKIELNGAFHHEYAPSLTSM